MIDECNITDRFIGRICKEEIIIYPVWDEYITKCENKKLANDEFVMSYLNNRNFLSILLDHTKCIFDNQSIAHHNTILSDGEWIWSADLNHYYEYHYFIFPEAFIAHVKQQMYNAPELSEECLFWASDISFLITKQFTTYLDKDSYRPRIDFEYSYRVEELQC